MLGRNRNRAGAQPDVGETMNSSGKDQIYRDPTASTEVRTADLLGRMTLDE